MASAAPDITSGIMAVMDLVIVIAVVAAALLLAELLLPTGGLLAVIGAAGFVAAGIIALGEDGDAADYIGPGLITLGVLSVITFFVITPKVIRAHTDEPIRTGWEELIGREAEVREPLDPVGQIWIEGALWKAKVEDGQPAIGLGNRVLIESVDGLTLVVRPVGGGTEPVQKGT
jgi:membrane-bound serine protease (ClpP class)